MRNYILSALLCLIFSGDLFSQSIQIAYEKDFGPYSFQNEQGEPEGALIDIYSLWAEKAGFAIEFVGCEGQECLNMIRLDKADILAGTVLESKDDQLTFAPPIIRLSTSLFVRNDNVPSTLVGFSGTIGVLKGSKVSSTFSEEYPNIKLQIIETHEELKQLVEDQALDAFVFEMPDPTDPDLKMRIPDGYTRFQHLSTIEFRPVVKSDRMNLIRSIFEEGAQITSEELVEISARHNLYISKRTNYWVVYISIVGVLLLAVIVLIVRNSYLKSRSSTLTIEDQDWAAIISEGEHDRVEFKSSFRWDYRQEKPNKALEGVIMKTIAAFLNTEGGILFIGVDDEGGILGLENDYNSLSKSSRDGFLLAMTNLVNQSFGKDIHRLLKINVTEINSLDICAVTISKSEKPVFLGKQGNEEFFVRASASSHPLSMSEALSYIKEQWPEG